MSCLLQSYLSEYHEVWSRVNEIGKRGDEDRRTQLPDLFSDHFWFLIIVLCKKQYLNEILLLMNMSEEFKEHEDEREGR